MRLPNRSASTSSSRCIVVAASGPWAGRRSASGADHAARAMPQPVAAAPMSFLMDTAAMAALSARSRSPQVRGRVVSRRALDRLADELFLVAQPHREVATRLQVVVHLDRAEEHRHVVPVLVVELRRAPQIAAAVVLVDEQDGPAVLVDVERAPRVDVAGALL